MPTTMKQFIVKTGKLKLFSIMSALPNKSNSSDILVEKIVPKLGLWGLPNVAKTTYCVGQDTVHKIGGFRGYCHC